MKVIVHKVASYFIALVTLFFLPQSKANNFSVTPLFVSGNETLVASLRHQQIDSIDSESVNLLYLKVDTLPPPMFMPRSRIEKVLAGAAAVCVFNKLKNLEREFQYIFSLPVNFYLNHRLYLATHHTLSEDVYTDGGKVNLLDAVNSIPNSIIAVDRAVSYGDKIDEQLKLLNIKQKIVTGHSTPILGTIKMLKKKRIDWFISYPSVVRQHFNHQEYMALNEFEIYDVPAVVAGHVMCNKRESSWRFLKKINKILMAAYVNGELLDLHSRYANYNEVVHFEAEIEKLINVDTNRVVESDY